MKGIGASVLLLIGVLLFVILLTFFSSSTPMKQTNYQLGLAYEKFRMQKELELGIMFDRSAAALARNGGLPSQAFYYCGGYNIPTENETLTALSDNMKSRMGLNSSTNLSISGSDVGLIIELHNVNYSSEDPNEKLFSTSNISTFAHSRYFYLYSKMAEWVATDASQLHYNEDFTKKLNESIDRLRSSFRSPLYCSYTYWDEDFTIIRPAGCEAVYGKPGIAVNVTCKDSTQVLVTEEGNITPLQFSVYLWFQK